MEEKLTIARILRNINFEGLGERRVLLETQKGSTQKVKIKSGICTTLGVKRADGF